MLIGAVAMLALGFLVVLGPLIFVTALKYAPWLEPLTMLTGLAAATSTVRLATGVIIPALRGAPLLAKTAATLTFGSAQAAPDGTVVTGSVHGAPSSTFTLSFYAGSPCADDTNGHLLGTTTVKSNAAGDAGFSLKVAGTVHVGDPVGLTARLPFFAPTPR